MTTRVADIYAPLRRMARRVLIRFPRIDRALGRQLAGIDARLHELGILRAFDRSGVVRWEGFDIHFERADANLARQLYLNNEYEPATSEAILRNLRPGSTFVDLGAHIGVFSMLAARCVGEDGHVFAFEPVPRTRRVLERNIAANNLTNICVVPFATSDKRETLSFISTNASEANGVAVANDAWPRINVNATDLDSYFRDRNWPSISLVKMDVEGQELPTLRGMKELLSRTGRPPIIFEYNLDQLRRTGTSRSALFDLLYAYGYSAYDVMFRTSVQLRLPEELETLHAHASRANVNIMARSGP